MLQAHSSVHHSEQFVHATISSFKGANTRQLSREMYYRIKRLIDLFLVVLGGIFFVPLCAIIALLIRFDSRGPVVFRHERFGRGGRRFRVLKFRTMAVNGDELLKSVLDSNPELRAEWERDQKLRNDPRVTRMGRFLRITSLDELPQLWNVFKGEMSLVGPRPIVANEFNKYGAKLDVYMQATPGITGLWQVSGRNNTTYDQRVNYDCQYVAAQSTLLDLKILLRTVKVVLFREGAY
jgi:Undecaprenyl-phosphate galactose phosphotransferase WbaP